MGCSTLFWYNAPVARIIPVQADACIDAVFNGVSLILQGSEEKARNCLRELPTSPQSCSSKRSVSPRQQADVFMRDRFMCRYCGQRTVFVPVLRLLSSIFPLEFPYHANWKMTECHIAYWKCAASCDHISPVARGGNSSAGNLVTACYRCNSMKQNWLLEELRWEMLSVPNTKWDGLSSLYQKLRTRTPDGESPYHAEWQRVIDMARKTAQVQHQTIG